MSQHEFYRGLTASTPIVIGYFPIAIAFGVIAGQAGMSLWQAVTMSLAVYAGASQFMAASMIATGAGGIEIVLATFVLNLRHLIMSMSLMNRIGSATLPFSKRSKMGLAYWITDETFAMASMNEKLSPAFLTGLMGASYLSWATGTAAGSLLTDVIPASVGASMSIGLYAMFIGLLVPAVRASWRAGMIALLSMLVGWAASEFVSGGWSIVIGTLAGSVLGILLFKESEAA